MLLKNLQDGMTTLLHGIIDNLPFRSKNGMISVMLMLITFQFNLNNLS